MESAKSDWRFKTLCQLKQRNKVEHEKLKALINGQTDLQNKVQRLQQENSDLVGDNQRLRANQTSGSSSGRSDDPTVQQLERKVYSLQEELTDIHRQKSDNAQQMLAVSQLVQEKEKMVAAVENKLAYSESELYLSREELAETKERLKKAEYDYQFMIDEFNALNLLYDSLEEKYKHSQVELKDVVDRWMIFKEQDVQRMNAENDAAAKRMQDVMEASIREAASEPKSVTEASKFASDSPFSLTTKIPKRPFCYKNVHDGHINALKHTVSGIFLASGGSDQRVKIWKVGPDSMVKQSTLTGCSAAITSIDFSSDESYILASSNDYASYIWTVADQRVRSTLTGHTGKVLTAKYLPDDSFVITGSYDRTLKLWDIRNAKCVRTLFPGSSCNDLVTTHSQWHTVISGHFDKKIRLYDTRSSDTTIPKEISVCLGRITSLSLSTDGLSLLCSGRDDALRMIDLRNNKVVHTYLAEGFHIGADYVRAAFSPDESFVTCGSNSGDVFIWNVASGNLEATLSNEEERNCILDCSWNPTGKVLFTGDKNNTITSWTC